MDKKFLIIGLLFADAILISTIVWFTDISGWNIWVRQIIIAILLLANLVIINRYKLR